jgi:hypothetical protein
VALDPATPGYSAALIARAKAELTTQTAWIAPALNFNVATDANVTYVGGLLTVRITYPTNKISAVIPFLNLPGIGRVPNLPATLTASASLQF